MTKNALIFGYIKTYSHLVVSGEQGRIFHFVWIQMAFIQEPEYLLILK